MSDRTPDPRAEGGGLTGATGDLTSDLPDEDFVPAETRELTDPQAARQLTAATHRRAEARRTERVEPGQLLERGDQTAPNDRDGGYGSAKGLAADDPAYRMEEHATPAAQPSARRGETVLGGDEQRDPEDEHL
ncbi:MAG TPA: hypothetical protein VFY43_04970 [Candidatus Limnocylindria bacterium]|nr:hypothetical protein [Candidatus Limnocylindria bacterium]